MMHQISRKPAVSRNTTQGFAADGTNQLDLALSAHPKAGVAKPIVEIDLPTGAAKECRIVAVGKRRDGGTRYWCLQHRADATAKYGRRAKRCRYADQPPLQPRDVLRLDSAEFPGGIALWGAVPPIYDTTRLPLDRGIHVHARRVPRGDKSSEHSLKPRDPFQSNRCDRFRAAASACPCMPVFRLRLERFPD